MLLHGYHANGGCGLHGVEEITGEKCGEAAKRINGKQFSLGGAVYGQGQSGNFQYVKP